MPAKMCLCIFDSERSRGILAWVQKKSTQTPPRIPSLKRPEKLFFAINACMSLGVIECHCIHVQGLRIRHKSLICTAGQRGKRGRWRYFTRTMPRGYCELGRDGVVEVEEEESTNINNRRINSTINFNTYINNNTNVPGLL